MGHDVKAAESQAMAKNTKKKALLKKNILENRRQDADAIDDENFYGTSKAQTYR